MNPTVSPEPTNGIVLRIRVNGWVLALLLLLAAWSALALIGLLRENPFRVATHTAAEVGGWSPEQVRFERGTFWFLGVCSTSRAHVAVTTAEGERQAEIELRHVPFAGWTVKRFEVGELR